MWRDLDRPPLNQERLRHDLRDSNWRNLIVVSETDSTQTEAIARRGEGDAVVIAEWQRAGRGRRDRSWKSPARAGITMSLLFRQVPPSPWLGVMVSLAAAEAINSLGQTDLAGLKWPNDILLGHKKVGGVISEVNGADVVVGIGINVTTRAEELPENATSLSIEGFTIDRPTLIKEILRHVAHEVPVDIRDRYRALLKTLGASVRVMAPEKTIEGIAVDIDEDGRLVLDSGVTFAVGDVVHLR